MSSTFELLDERGEEFLRRVAPDGEWSTCDGLILDRDWQPVTSHKVLVVERTLPVRVWDSESGPHLAIPDDLPSGAWIARHATRDGQAASGLFFSPEAMENIAKERSTPGMRLRPRAWVSELEDQARADGWERLE